MGALADKDINAFEIARLYGEERENAFAHLLFRPDIEVKSDKKASGTGRIFLEYEQGEPPRPSGIAVTKANLWVYELVDLGWFVVETERLKHLGRIAFRDEKLRKTGGDNQNKGVLIPLEWLVRLNP